MHDAELVALGNKFDEIANALDDAIENKTDLMDLLEQLRPIDAALAATSAKSIDGLRVKARAACWSRLGDLDPTDESTTDRRMALSIVRDLIRLYDPGLERPNALQELVADLD
jgi:hypothetical protein